MTARYDESNTLRRHVRSTLTACTAALVAGGSAFGASSAMAATSIGRFENVTPGISINQKGDNCSTGVINTYTVPSPYGSCWTVSDEWGFVKAAPAFDEAVVDTGEGDKAWRLSNAVTNSGYANQPNAPSTAAAGETTAGLWNNRGPSHTSPTGPSVRAYATTRFFNQAFLVKSATGAAQAGLSVVISPIPRQSTKRMSYLQIVDNGSAGLDLKFYDTLAGGTFPAVATTIASNLSYSDWHKIEIDIEFVDGLNVDGSGNDVVKIHLNGSLIHTGTTWETYFWNTAAEFPPGTLQADRKMAVDALLFRVAGAAAAGTAGNGLLFDSLDVRAPAVASVSASPLSLPATGGSVTLTASTSDTRSKIATLEYKLDAGSWTAMTVDDGTYDELSESASKAVPVGGGGDHTLCVRATDVEGNTSDGTDCVTVNVAPPASAGMTGFFHPVDMNDVLNVAKAGQGIPLKFKLDVDPMPGLAVTVTSVQYNCSSGATIGTDEIEVYTGSSGLQYLGSGNWQWNWRTPKTYANQCRTVTLTPSANGYAFNPASITAKFQFKK